MEQIDKMEPSIYYKRFLKRLARRLRRRLEKKNPINAPKKTCYNGWSL